VSPLPEQVARERRFADEPRCVQPLSNSRRHLSQSQRAMLGARMAKQPIGGTGINQYTKEGSPTLETPLTAAEAAKVAGVGTSLITQARKVLAKFYARRERHAAREQRHSDRRLSGERCTVPHQSDSEGGSCSGRLARADKADCVRSSARAHQRRERNRPGDNVVKGNEAARSVIQANDHLALTKWYRGFCWPGGHGAP
jgi:hypothetical protein